MTSTNFTSHGDSLQVPQRITKRKAISKADRSRAALEHPSILPPNRTSISSPMGQSYISELEARIADLEAQASELRQGDASCSADQTYNEGTRRQPFRNDQRINAVEIGLPGALSDEWLAFNLRSCVHFAIGCSEDMKTAMVRPQILHTDHLLSDQISVYLESYLSRVHCDLPFLRRSDLTLLQDELRRDLDLPNSPIHCLVLAIGSLVSGPKSLVDYQQTATLLAYAKASPSRFLENHSLESLQILLLFTIFSLLDARGGCSWQLSGLALSVAISLGLHKEENLEDHGLDSDVQRNAFWSCYIFDRCIALATYRPFGIQDEDITTAPPSHGETTRSLATLCLLTHEVCRQRVGSISNPPLRSRFFHPVIRTKTSYSLSSLLSYHLYTWYLNPPFAWSENLQSEIIGEHRAEYFDLLVTSSRNGCSLPWVIGASVFHTEVIFHFVSMLVHTSSDDGREESHQVKRNTASDILTGIAAEFMSIQPLVTLSEVLQKWSTENPNANFLDPSIVQNSSTRRLLRTLQAFNT